MMKFYLLPVFIVLTISCSTKTRDEIETQKKQQQDVNARSDLNNRIRTIINSSEKLSGKQKWSFINLHDDVVKKTERQTQNIRKLKLVLLKHLADEEYDKSKVDEIKKQLRRANKQRMEIMLEAMSGAKDILGVNFSDVYDEDDFRYRSSYAY